MKVIIDIPDEYVKKDLNDSCFSVSIPTHEMSSILSSGTLLLKPHGKLVDADSLYNMIKDFQIADNDNWFSILQKLCVYLHDVDAIVDAES